MTDAEALRSHILDLGSLALSGDATAKKSLCAIALLTAPEEPPVSNVELFRAYIRSNLEEAA